MAELLFKMKEILGDTDTDDAILAYMLHVSPIIRKCVQETPGALAHLLDTDTFILSGDKLTWLLDHQDMFNELVTTFVTVNGTRHLICQPELKQRLIDPDLSIDSFTLLKHYADDRAIGTYVKDYSGYIVNLFLDQFAIPHPDIDGTLRFMNWNKTSSAERIADLIECGLLTRQSGHSSRGRPVAAALKPLQNRVEALMRSTRRWSSESSSRSSRSSYRTEDMSSRSITRRRRGPHIVVSPRDARLPTVKPAKKGRNRDYNRRTFRKFKKENEGRR
jgi:hypothetical protein